MIQTTCIGLSHKSAINMPSCKKWSLCYSCRITSISRWKIPLTSDICFQKSPENVEALTLLRWMVFGHVVDHLVRRMEQQTSSAPGGWQGQAARCRWFFWFWRWSFSKWENSMTQDYLSKIWLSNSQQKASEYYIPVEVWCSFRFFGEVYASTNKCSKIQHTTIQVK